MNPLLDRIAEIAAMPDLEPETKQLLEMAAQAQETGQMPPLGDLTPFPNCPRCGKAMTFRPTEYGPKFQRFAECHTCKIAGCGATDKAAWEMLMYFEK